MKRRGWWALGVLAALCLGGLALERTYYPVGPDLSGLETGLRDFWMRGRPAGTPPEMLVHQCLPVGDRLYVLFEVGPELDLGTAALDRSWSGRWRVGRMGWGGGSFRQGVVEVGGTKFLLFGGRNTGGRIARADCTLDGSVYTLEIPRGERFLVRSEVDDAAQARHFDLGSLRLFDRTGRDITADYDLSSGGI